MSRVSIRQIARNWGHHIHPEAARYVPDLLPQIDRYGEVSFDDLKAFTRHHTSDLHEIVAEASEKAARAEALAEAKGEKARHPTGRASAPEPEAEPAQAPAPAAPQGDPLVFVPSSRSVFVA